MDNSLTTIYRQIASIGHRLGAEQVVLYGSRARGDQRPRSDIDLAVFGAAPETYARFLDALEELPTLLDQGYTDVNSPKSVMKQAYADGLIQDEAGWLALLTARNQASHIYEEATAQAVFLAVKATYLPLLRALAEAVHPE